MEEPIDNINQIILQDKMFKLIYKKDKKLKLKSIMKLFSEQLMGNKYLPKYYYYKSQDGDFYLLN